MANEIWIGGQSTGLTVYAVVSNEAGQAWNGVAFVTYTTTRDTFDVPMTEIGVTGRYALSFPGTAGQRTWEVFIQAGVSPSHANDISIGQGSGYWDGTVLGVRASAVSTTALAALAAAAGGAVSAFLVDEDHTWSFQNRTQTTAPMIISEVVGFNGLCAMDFTQPMPANAVIASVGTVAIADVTGETEPTLGTAAISVNKKQVHIPINATAATDSTYTITATITTTDSQVFTRKGRLTIVSAS